MMQVLLTGPELLPETPELLLAETPELLDDPFTPLEVPPELLLAEAPELLDDPFTPLEVPPELLLAETPELLLAETPELLLAETPELLGPLPELLDAAPELVPEPPSPGVFELESFEPHALTNKTNKVPKAEAAIRFIVILVLPGLTTWQPSRIPSNWE